MTPFTILRTTPEHPDFVTLVRLLDAELAVIDGEEHAFYAQYNGVSDIKEAVVLYADNQPVACGALKAWEPGIIEVKRMFTLPEWRGKGVASSVLRALEQWAGDLGCHSCVLETGKRQEDAVHLYLKNGYAVIPNYGQYIGIENSICFQKKIAGITP